MRLLLCLAAVVMLSSPARAAPDYADMVLALADGAVVPAYRAFATETERLAGATAAYCASPTSDSLVSTRAAFRAAMLAWQRAQPSNFGPVEINSRAVRIQFWPDRRGTGARQLRRTLRAADPALITPGGLAGRSVAVQGFPALERLIYTSLIYTPAQSATQREPQAAPKPPHTPRLTPYACALATAISRFLEASARDLLTEWTGPDGYRTRLVPPPGGNAVYATTQESAADFLKAMSTALDVIIDRKLEPVLGDSLATAAPRRAESWRSGLSHANIAANLDTLALWVSVPGGFRDQLARAGASGLGIELETAFRNAAVQAAAIPAPLSEAVADPALRKQVDALLVAVRGLRAQIRRSVAGKLGLVIGFNSLDGD